jgi:hypothetical protein
MKTFLNLTLTAVGALLLASCAPPAVNNANAGNSNANANTAKTGAAPTVDALKALETKAFDAWKNKDGKFFEGFLADNFTMLGQNGQMLDKAATVKEISGHKCEVKSFAFSDAKMIMAGADAAVIIMKVTADGTCPHDKGVQQKILPMVSASVYVRSGSEWKGAFHKEVDIVDPRTMNFDDKTRQPSAPPAKEEKDAIANKAVDVKPATDANTEALLAIEKRLWEAWKSRDAKPLEELIARDFLFVDIFGNVIGSKADAIEMWTTANKCEVRSFSLSDVSSVSIAKDASILQFKGTADGTCSGVALNFTISGSGVYVKEGDVWKYAFGFNKTV